MLHGIWALLLLAMACPAGPLESQISREQAIEIARQEVSFQPDSIEAVLSESRERPLWRVTFRGRLPGPASGTLRDCDHRGDPAELAARAVRRPGCDLSDGGFTRSTSLCRSGSARGAIPVGRWEYP